MFNIKNAAQKASVAATGLILSGLAAAQTAGDPFTTAMSDATGKVGTYAAALVGLSAVSVVFMIGMKYVKKIRGAA